MKTWAFFFLLVLSIGYVEVVSCQSLSEVPASSSGQGLMSDRTGIVSPTANVVPTSSVIQGRSTDLLFPMATQTSLPASLNDIRPTPSSLQATLPLSSTLPSVFGTLATQSGMLGSGIQSTTAAPTQPSSTIPLQVTPTPSVPDRERPYLLFANREFIQQVNLDGSDQKVLRNVSETNAIAIDFDARQGYMFWSDVTENKIYRAFIDGTNTTELVTTGLAVPDGLAWDWVNKKLYWTDAETDEVEVYDPALGLRKTLIYTGEETIPRGIVVDPTTRHLYWTDWGTVAKIEKASMDGKERTVLIDTQLDWPNAITIDYETNRLYWADARLDKIESSDTFGLFRTTLTDNGFFIRHPFAMTTFKNRLYWSDWSFDLVVTTEISNPSNVSSVLFEILPTEPMGVQVVTEQRQPQAFNPCAAANGNCSHLCLLSAVAPSGFSCACPDGMVLAPNNVCIKIVEPTPTSIPQPPGSCVAANFTSCCTTGDCLGEPKNCFCHFFCFEFDTCCSDISEICSPANTTTATLLPTPTPTVLGPRPYLLFANRELIQQVNLDGSDQRVLRNVTGSNAIGLDFDYRQEYMFWSDVNENKIYRAAIDGTGVTELITSGLDIPDGIAWDWVNEKLYWTDSGSDEVEVYDPVSGLRMTLISTGEESIPRGITVDPMTRHVYWTDWGTVAKIEKASMDGKERTVLIDTELVWPNGITIDYETKILYWVDANLDKIESADSSGRFRRKLQSGQPLLHPFDITFFNSKLYWSDWGSEAISSLPLSIPEQITPTTLLLSDPMALHVVAEERQPEALNPCAAANGNCSHLCLLSAVAPNGFSCGCPNGMVLSASNNTCTMRVVSTTAPSPTPEPLGSCVAANFTSCCTTGDCLGEPKNCFCDFFCFELGRCCPDIREICPTANKTTALSVITPTPTLMPSTSSPLPTPTMSPPPAYLIFANRQQIYRMKLTGTEQETLVTGESNAIGLDYDYRRQQIYWTDVIDDVIRTANLDGSNAKTIVDTDLNVPDGLAVDWITGLLYWTDAQLKRIEVYDPSNGNRMLLVSTGTSTIPRAIVVDPNTRWLYWTDWGTPSKIERASMDGLQRVELHNSSLIWPNALTIDYENQELYWADANLDVVEKSRVDGSLRMVITARGIFHPFAVTFWQKTLFMSDWFLNAIVTVSTDTTNTTTNILFSNLGTDPMAIHVVTPLRQEIKTLNPCAAANGNCSHLCLLSAVAPSGFSCACPNGMNLTNDGKNCIKLPQTTGTQSPVQTPTPTPTPTVEVKGSCIAAGYRNCCTDTVCEGEPKTCFCDFFCLELNDCCEDFHLICRTQSLSVSISTPPTSSATSTSTARTTMSTTAQSPPSATPVVHTQSPPSATPVVHTQSPPSATPVAHTQSSPAVQSMPTTSSGSQGLPSITEMPGSRHVTEAVVGGLVGAIVVVVIIGVLIAVLVVHLIARHFKHRAKSSYSNQEYDIFENAPDQAEMVIVNNSASDIKL